MKRAKLEALYQGWRLAKAGLDAEALGDWVEIHRLNARAVALWTASNNSDGNWDEAEYLKNDTAQERAVARATAIAKLHDWRIDMSGGLWWTVCQGDKELR